MSNPSRLNCLSRLDGEKETPQLQPIFVSVDWRRDNSETMREYLDDLECSEIIGLTGVEEEVKKIAKSYRVYYSVGPKDEEGNYMVSKWDGWERREGRKSGKGGGRVFKTVSITFNY